MATIYSNLQAGTTTTAPLLIAGTSLDSAGFSNLPTIAAPDVLWLTLDPTAIAGLPEIVQVTAHSAASTNVTIVRGQQGTVARQQLAGTIWRHSSTKADFDELAFRKLTTTGDTLYASAANTTGRLPIGTTGQRLSVAAGVPAWVADSANSVITAAGDLIVGSGVSTAARLAVGTANQSLSVVAGVPAWTGLTAYTPAITWAGNTVSAVVAQYTHVPGFLIIAGQFLNTGSAVGAITIPLPGGFTAATVTSLTVQSTTSGAISLTVPAAGASFTTAATPGATNGQTYGFSVTVPVAT